MMKLKKIITLLFFGLICCFMTTYANDMEVMFEETYNFENYYMDGNTVTSAFENKDGVRMWELRQNTPKMLLDVVPANREGYGDMLRIATTSSDAAVFYGQNSGTGNFLPEVKDGVVVIETDYYMSSSTLPTKNSYIMGQLMTTQGSAEQMINYVIRRDGENIYLYRDIKDSATVVHSGAFPEGKWIKIRTVFDYTWGKWFCVYIDENGESHWLAHGSNIPAYFTNSGVRNVRITYDVRGNSGTAQLFTDNFRCYKLNNVTTQTLGYAAVKTIADGYSAMPQLTNSVYAPTAENTFMEDFSSYKTVPAALLTGDGAKWSASISGAYLGGVTNVDNDPDSPTKRALFMSASESGADQAAHAWVAPENVDSLCFDGKIRVTDPFCEPYVALTMQNSGVNMQKLITFKGGQIYFAGTLIADAQANVWYNFNLLLNETDKTAFISLTDGTTVNDMTVELSNLEFDNPIRMTVGNCYTENTQGENGVYFGDLAISNTTECIVDSSLLKSKDLLGINPQIDLKFTNFVSAEELKNIVLSYKDVNGEEKAVNVSLSYIGSNVKNAVVIPDTLVKNCDYTIDFSNVEDILGNSVTPDKLTFKTGDPALMDVLDINSFKVTNNNKTQEYLTEGTTKVEINCTNISSDETEASVILILYDGYVMEDVVVSDAITINKDEKAVLSAEIDIPEEYENCRLRVCVWDGVDSGFALTKSYVLDAVEMIRE